MHAKTYDHVLWKYYNTVAELSPKTLKMWVSYDITTISRHIVASKLKCLYSIKQTAWMYMPIWCIQTIACKFNLLKGQARYGQHVGNASGFSRHISHRTSRAVEEQNMYQSKLMVYKQCQVIRNSQNSACEVSQAKVNVWACRLSKTYNNLMVTAFTSHFNCLLQRCLQHVGG